jgi:hypothetical protein
MTPMKMTVKSGATLAVAAAALMLASTGSAPTAQAADGKGMCVGANACKGQSACKTASSQCNGLNSCKGQGWLELTEAECAKIEGAKFEPKS